MALPNRDPLSNFPLVGLPRDLLGVSLKGLPLAGLLKDLTAFALQ